MKKNRITGNAVALLTVMIWGLTFVSTRILLESFTPGEILVLRFALAYLALCLIAAPFVPRASFRTEMLFAFAGLSGITLYFLFENMALLYTSVSNVGIIVSTTPFFTAILAWLFLHSSRPGLYYYLGFVLAMAGIFLICTQGKALELNLQGDGLSLLASLSWAVYTVLTRKLSGYGYDSLSITRRVFFYGLLFMLPLLFTESFHISPDELLLPVNITNLLFLGLGASALCFVTWTYALNSLGAASASAYIYLVPMVTIFASALLLNEKITSHTMVGAILTILGLLLSERKGSGKAGRNE